MSQEQKETERERDRVRNRIENMSQERREKEREKDRIHKQEMEIKEKRREKYRDKARERDSMMSIVQNIEGFEEEWEKGVSEILPVIENTNDFFDNFEQSLLRAVLLWYLNTGNARFCGVEKPHDQRIIKEIKDKSLTKTDHDEIIEKFYKKHAFGRGNFLSCGACGIQQLPCINESLQEICLEELPECYEYDKNKKDELFSMIHGGPISIPVDNLGENWKDIDYWKVISFYPQENLNQSTKIYHLHPELIHDKTTDHGVKKATYLCSKCMTATNNKSSSKLSIANGIDFGNYERIGLNQPNQHEQAIIAKVRKYMKVIKIQQNGRNGSGVSNFTLNKIMAHAVLFPHDCDKVAFDCLSEEHVVNAIKIQFVTQEQNVDTLIRDTLGSNNIIGRFHIIWQ